METAAALDATKAAAEGTAIDETSFETRSLRSRTPPRPDETLETQELALA